MTTEEKPDRLKDHLIQQDAQRQAPVTGASNFEAMMARISAQVTADAAKKKAEETARREPSSGSKGASSA